jgi:glycosyltransferase involved in cell wall biosynthesis
MINVLDRLPEGYTLDIYGDGNFDEVTDLKEKLIAKSNVTYKGPTNDVAATLAGYSLFLMTSRYEGFGQTLIEARSQGLPLVVYNTFDALSWIVDDTQTGCIVPNGHTQTFTESVMKICENKERFIAMSNNALCKAVDTESKYVSELWENIL